MMPDPQLLILFGLTFIINLVGSLAYSVRIAGVRTMRIAVSFSMFNILVLVSRTANSFQSPMLAKRVESHIAVVGAVGSQVAAGSRLAESGLADFRWLIGAASLATLCGALLTPTLQRLFARGVDSFAEHRSLPRLMFRAFSAAGLAQIRGALVLPRAANVSALFSRSRISISVIAMNMIATAVWTVGVFASIYAGYLNPQLRSTASNLSGIINGLSTILLFIVVDPYLSLVTDDVIKGRATEPFFRRSVVWLLASRLGGTLLAQLLLVPAAMAITAAARWL
jgi:hypothetical protein